MRGYPLNPPRGTSDHPPCKARSPLLYAVSRLRRVKWLGGVAGLSANRLTTHHSASGLGRAGILEIPEKSPDF